MLINQSATLLAGSILALPQSEVAPKQIRGTLVGTYQLFITIGILLAYSFGIGTREIDGAGSWRTLIGIGFVFAFILGIGIQFMPESPVRLSTFGILPHLFNGLTRRLFLF